MWCECHCYLQRHQCTFSQVHDKVNLFTQNSMVLRCKTPSIINILKIMSMTSIYHIRQWGWITPYMGRKCISQLELKSRYKILYCASYDNMMFIYQPTSSVSLAVEAASCSSACSSRDLAAFSDAIFSMAACKGVVALCCDVAWPSAPGVASSWNLIDLLFSSANYAQGST